jgi:pimeloyl-ACP methyl ester carboxylesterase
MDTTWHDDEQISKSKKEYQEVKGLNRQEPTEALYGKNSGNKNSINKKKKGGKKYAKRYTAPVDKMSAPAPITVPVPVKIPESKEYLTLSNGEKVFYHVIGEQRIDRPTLFFIHGYTTDSTIWKYQQEYFSKHTQTVVIDLPGHGLSKTAQIGNNVTDIIHSIVTSLKVSSLILIGWQLGCLHVLSYLKTYPTRTRKAILINPTMEMFALPTNINHYFPELGIFKGKDLSYIENNRLMFESVLQKNNVPYPLPTIENVDDIETPIMIVFGGRDKILNFSTSLHLRTQLKNSNIVELENSGYIPLITTSNSLNTHILRYVRV